jgi:hypothetical protein
MRTPLLPPGPVFGGVGRISVWDRGQDDSRMTSRTNQKTESVTYNNSMGVCSSRCRRCADAEQPHNGSHHQSPIMYHVATFDSVCKRSSLGYSA